jgi:SAM-dependent methyltransferase
VTVGVRRKLEGLEMTELNKSKGGGYGSVLHNLFKNRYLNKFVEYIYPPPPIVNCISRKKLEVIRAALFKSENKILDIGSGLRKGVGARIWLGNASANCEVVNLDIVDGESVDIVADATDIPDGIGPFDAVIMQAVPEHVANQQALFSEAKRMLKNGGYLYIEMPFLQGFHADPDDYWRMTLPGLKLQVSDMNLIESGVSCGPTGALIWIITDLFSSLTGCSKLNICIRFMLRWIFSPFRYIDFLVSETEASNRLAAEYFILAQKPNNHE